MTVANTTDPKADVTFYIPCLNEEENIGATLRTVFEAIRPFPYRCEIIAVDDGSQDGTLGILESCSLNHPPIPLRVIKNQETKGLGYNYFATALEARGEYYMLVNGDNAEPVETLRAILTAKGKGDMIIPYFGRNDRRNFVRRAISALFTGIVNAVTWNRIYYYNGPVLHRSENVRLYHAETGGYGYQAELICKLLNAGKTYTHVLVKNSDRERGFSKAFSLANFLSVGNSLFHIFLRQCFQVLYVLLGFKKPKRVSRNSRKDCLS